MPWICKTTEEFKTTLIENHGKRILKDIEIAKAGKMTLKAIADKYGITQGRAGQIYHRIYPNTKKILERKSNKEYLDCRLAGCNRGTVQGFTRYWSQRQGFFQNTFGVAYSAQAAEREFRGIGL